MAKTVNKKKLYIVLNGGAISDIIGDAEVEISVIDYDSDMIDSEKADKFVNKLGKKYKNIDFEEVDGLCGDKSEED